LNDTTLQPDPHCPPPTHHVVAELHGRRFPNVPACTNCGAPVQVTNYALGPKVEHYDPDSSFPTQHKGTAWRECRTRLVATMPEEASR
jgi:hypothetical protein